MHFSLLVHIGFMSIWDFSSKHDGYGPVPTELTV
jgi:hypothetical protein